MSGVEAYRVPKEKEEKKTRQCTLNSELEIMMELGWQVEFHASADGGTTNRRILRGGRRTHTGQLSQGVQASRPW